MYPHLLHNWWADITKLKIVMSRDIFKYFKRIELFCTTWQVWLPTHYKVTTTYT